MFFILLPSSVVSHMRYYMEFIPGLDILWGNWYWGTANCQKNLHPPIHQILWPMSGFMMLSISYCPGWAPWEFSFPISYSYFLTFLVISLLTLIGFTLVQIFLPNWFLDSVLQSMLEGSYSRIYLEYSYGW